MLGGLSCEVSSSFFLSALGNLTVTQRILIQHVLILDIFQVKITMSQCMHLYPYLQYSTDVSPFQICCLPQLVQQLLLAVAQTPRKYHAIQIYIFVYIPVYMKYIYGCALFGGCLGKMGPFKDKHSFAALEMESWIY